MADQDTTGRASAGRLLWLQAQYQNKIFWRTPVAAFFTVIFPLLIFVIFSLVFGNETIDYLNITVAQYYAPSLAVFAAVSATYTNLAVTTSYQRDQGILKRVRGTPLRPSLYLGGKIASATEIAALSVVIMMSAGVLFYGVQIYARTLPAAIVTFIVGVGCFAALGLLVAGIAPSGQAATAITNATLLPLAFLSGIFIVPGEDPPAWLTAIGNFFPLKHFNDAFQAAFNPEATGAQFQWADLAYMALWGVVAMLIAVRVFRWEPPAGGGRRRKEKPDARV